MDSIRTNLNINSVNSTSGAKTPLKNQKTTSTLPKDGFVSGEKIDLIKKPEIKTDIPMNSNKALEVMARLDPATQASIASAGGPIFKSIPGALAKWLITDEQESQIGEMMAKQIEKQFTVSQDPEMNARLQKIGQGIAKNSKRPGLNYSFKVIEEESVNAFAGPGGKIYVHSGLMKKFPSDAHLAFVVGHEMGHVEHRDSIDRLGVQFVLGIAQAVLGKTPGKLDDMLAGVTGMLYDCKVSQKAEFIADRRGIDHMKELGYDPKDAAGALLGLKYEGYKEPGLLEKMFASHPPIDERAENANKYARKVSR
ncbi:MAG: M48 family metalloprotease [Vulcanimicrobiota bacterium]